MTVSTRKGDHKTVKEKKPISDKAAKPGIKKPLRIREELLPDSATYGTFAGREYLMIPVEDFAEWYEDLHDAIAADCAMEEPGESIPMEKAFAELDRRKEGK